MTHVNWLHCQPVRVAFGEQGTPTSGAKRCQFLLIHRTMKYYSSNCFSPAGEGLDRRRRMYLKNETKPEKR